MRIANKSFAVFMAAMLAVFVAFPSFAPCLGQDQEAAVHKKSVLPEEFRAITISQIKKTSRQTIYIDPVMAAMDDKGAIYVRGNAPYRMETFRNPWEFEAVKLIVAFETKSQKLRIYDFDMAGDEFTYCSRNATGGAFVDLGDTSKAWYPAEQVTTSKGKSAVLPEELRGVRIWEVFPNGNCYVSTKCIRLDENGVGWIDGGQGVRRSPFSDGFGPAARVIIDEKLTFCDVDLTSVTHRFEWRGTKPQQTLAYQKDVLDKAGAFNIQLVNVMPIRKWIAPPPAQPASGKVTVNADPPLGK
jgi:hypothetical protein